MRRFFIRHVLFLFVFFDMDIKGDIPDNSI